jgi:molybdopterin molybdotransferase
MPGSVAPSLAMSAPLLGLDEAQRLVLDSAQALDRQLLELRGALGRVLAEDVVATEPVPAFASSAMDGFAIRAEDVRGAGPTAPIRLSLAGESRAGRPAARGVGPGEAIAISTGAMMPRGANAVIRQEETRTRERGVEVLAQVRPGHDVRAAGEDIAPGETVLARGIRLGPAELGVLASLGRATVSCTRRPRVSILTTGDELVEPTAPQPPGAVRNTNAYSIPALAQCAGAHVTRIAHSPDIPDCIQAAIVAALDDDVVVVCGGVSVGRHDHVRGALAALDVEERFWGIALRPGKPTWFGVRDRTLVFGLPGNPVSAMVTFMLLVYPSLRALSEAAGEPAREMATLAGDYDKRPGRAHAMRCRLTRTAAGLMAEPTGPQGSHILTSMLGADALAIIPAPSGPLRSGEKVEIERLASWLGWTP